jgi:hypothetical protein
MEVNNNYLGEKDVNGHEGLKTKTGMHAEQRQTGNNTAKIRIILKVWRKSN